MLGDCMVKMKCVVKLVTLIFLTSVTVYFDLSVFKNVPGLAPLARVTTIAKQISPLLSLKITLFI